MRYIALMIIIGLSVFVSCKKLNSTTADVLFYNGTWSLPSISAAWNNTDIAGAVAIAQGQSSGTTTAPYAQVSAGTNLITLKAGATPLIDKKNIYAGAASNSSFIIFDSSTISATQRILQLTDDLSLPDTAKIKYRLLNLVPDTSVKVDIWLVNGATDSIRLDSANTFIGAAALAASVQAFDSTKYHGEQYTVKLRKSGTDQVYASIANYPFTEKGIYSIIFSGLLTGTGGSEFKLSVLRHRIP